MSVLRKKKCHFSRKFDLWPDLTRSNVALGTKKYVQSRDLVKAHRLFFSAKLYDHQGPIAKGSRTPNWQSALWEMPWPGEGKCIQNHVLTLAGTGHFASFHGTRGVGTTPVAVSPMIELELRGKNERVARRETKRLIYKLKVNQWSLRSGQVPKSDENSWLPITLLQMELEQHFNVQHVPCDE